MVALNPLKTYNLRIAKPRGTVSVATRSHDTDTRRPVTAQSRSLTDRRSAEDTFLLDIEKI